MTDSAAVLEARARELAQPLTAPDAGETMNVMTFTLQQEVYAIDSLAVREVCRDVEITALPGAARPIFGVAGWRGEIVPVVDVRALVGLAPASTSARTWLVIMSGIEHEVDGNAASDALALAVDGPGELRAIPVAALRPPPEGLVGNPHVRGVLPDGVVVLEAQRVSKVAGPESV